MTRLIDLIAELCPAGVEYRSLGEVATVATGVQLNRSGLTSDGLYAVFNGGVAPSGRHSEFNTAADTVIVSQGGASAGYVNFVREPFWAGAHCYVVQPNPSFVTARFLYFVLKRSQRELQAAKLGAGIPGLSRKALLTFRVPTPPLEVQDAAVEVLETFVDLESQLEAELEARRQQYAHYQSALMTPRDGWQRSSLGEIADVFDGPHATPTKTDSGPWYLSISSLVDGRFDLTQSVHIGRDQYDTWTRRVAARAGDTMFSYETRIGQAAHWDRDEPAALGRRMGLLRPRESKVDPRFLTLAYLGPEFQSLIQAKTVHGATVDRIAIGDMPTWSISIPSISEQKRIVAILDNFDALVNDLSIGLPAELSARRQQYEHYRDRLFTFSEAA